MTLPNRSLTSALALPAVTVTVVTGDHEGPQRGHLTHQAVALQTVQNFSRRVPGNAELLRELLQGRHRVPRPVHPGVDPAADDLVHLHPEWSVRLRLPFAHAREHSLPDLGLFRQDMPCQAMAGQDTPRHTLPRSPLSVTVVGGER